MCETWILQDKSYETELVPAPPPQKKRGGQKGPFFLNKKMGFWGGGF